MPCTQSDFKNIAGQILYPIYSQSPTQPMSVWYSSFLSFQANMWTHYQNSGCSWWANRVTLWTSQLLSITNPYNILLKNAKIAFAQQMHVTCGCPGPIPTITNPSSQAMMAPSSVCNINDFMAVGMCGNATNIPCTTSLTGSLHDVYDVTLGDPGQYFVFLFNMWDSYTGATIPNISGCSWWANRVALWTSQLPSLTAPNNILLKNAKINFAQQLHTVCNCPGPVPQ
tara:strand:+ start:8049 stop:8729 length:681 start_codon:yes stop_codon:yes gene_type:complete